MNNQLYSFQVMGQPVAKARPRMGPNGIYTPKETLEYEKKIKLTALAAGVKRMTPPICISTIFFLRDLRRIDGDNIQKIFMDALTGIAWIDDSWVSKGIWQKELDRDNPRVLVMLTTNLSEGRMRQ